MTAHAMPLTVDTARPLLPRGLELAAVTAILALASALHFIFLEREGFANMYYAATVKSMLSSGHNFFFASFDPGGFVAVDKPPLGLWLQAASASLLGFNGLALLLPQAAAGVASVALTYSLVRQAFGAIAALVAGTVLTLTPISIAANRNNTMDSVLVLVVLLTTFCALRAVRQGSWRWLLLTAAVLGIGFNVKMLQAFLVLPALALVYLAAARTSWWKRLAHLAAAAIVLAAVSLAWPLTVDLTPPENRPFVGSTQSNSVLELVLGHNGLNRLLPGGLRGILGGPVPPAPAQQPQPANQPLPPYQNPQVGNPVPPYYGQPGQPGRLGQPQVAPVAPGVPYSLPQQPNPQQPQLGQPQPPSPVSEETGSPGPLRLINKQLGGQLTWLLPLALFTIPAIIWQKRIRWRQLDERHYSLLLWSTWLVTGLVFFSMASLFHRYYLEMLAPAIAALVGGGVAALGRDCTLQRKRAVLLPLALGTTLAAQAWILLYFPAWANWLLPVVCVVTGLAILCLTAVLTIRPLSRMRLGPRLGPALAAVGLLGLLVAPATWSMFPVLSGGDTGLPYAGPELIRDRPRKGLPVQDRVTTFLQANKGSAFFLAATVNANTAAPLIIATGQPVMALGGFSGGDRILTRDELRARVARGELRFFLIPQQTGQQQDLLSWVRQNCSLSPLSQPQPAQLPRNPGPAVSDNAPQLWDCARMAAPRS